MSLTQLVGGSSCPKAFTSNTNYITDDLVNANTDYTMIHDCRSAPKAPQTSKDQCWDWAWTALDVCSRDMSPTSSLVYTALADIGRSLGAYPSSMIYEQGDRFLKTGSVHQCIQNDFSCIFDVKPLKTRKFVKTRFSIMGLKLN